MGTPLRVITNTLTLEEMSNHLTETEAAKWHLKSKWAYGKQTGKYTGSFEDWLLDLLANAIVSKDTKF